MLDGVVSHTVDYHPLNGFRYEVDARNLSVFDIMSVGSNEGFLSIGRTIARCVSLVNDLM